MNDLTIDTRADWTGQGSLTKLADTLKARAAASRDCCVDPRQLVIGTTRAGELTIAAAPGTQAAEFIPTDGMPIRDRAITQLCSRLNPEVPARFGKDLAVARPHIAIDLFNSLIDKDDYSKNRRWLVRMLNGRIRAVLSDRYLILDDEGMIFTALDKLRQVGGFPMSCTMTEDYTRMSYCCPSLGQYIDSPSRGDGAFFNAGSMGSQVWQHRVGVSDDILKPLTDRKGNTIFPGGEIGNSETGAGSAYVKFKTYDSICLNGCVSEVVHTIRHIGEKLDAGIWSRNTMHKNQQLKHTMVQDAIQTTFDADRLNAWMVKRQQASTDILAPNAAIDNVADLCELSQEERDNLLCRFCAEYKPTRDGLSQAAARLAQDETDPNKACDWEAHSATIIKQRSAVNRNALAIS